MANVVKDIGPGVRSLAVLPSAARTAAPADTFEFEGHPGQGARGVIMVIDVTAETGTPALTVKIMGVDRNSGKTWDILTSAGIATVSTVTMVVHPSVTAASNVAVNYPLPPVFRISAAHGNSDSITYSVSLHLVD